MIWGVAVFPMGKPMVSRGPMRTPFWETRRASRTWTGEAVTSERDPGNKRHNPDRYASGLILQLQTQWRTKSNLGPASALILYVGWG